MSEPLSGRVVDPGSGPNGTGGGRPGPDAIRGLSRKWAKAWIVPVVFGVASCVLGVLVVIWPRHTAGALAALFGLYLLITGVYRLVAAIQLKGIEPIARVVALVLAALSVVIGLVCLANPFTTAATFAAVVGAFWLAAGAITVLGAWQRQGRAKVGRAPGAAGGVLSVIIGLLIILFPGASLVLLAWILGCTLIFFGLSALATGLAARRLLKNVESAALYWP
jgi:uncharacterized membrane protein HdeD (DUF308 family)